MTSSPLVNELFTALSKAQAEISGALKDSSNPFYKSKYANLESVWAAAQGPLTKNGLCVMQSMKLVDGKNVLVTCLGHSSGQWVSGEALLNPVKDDPQGMGSAISYFRRYMLAAMVGVVQVDDDGEGAQGRGHPPAPPKASQPPQSKTYKDSTTGNGFHPPNQGYRIPAGKYAKRALHEVARGELEDYVDYLERDAAQKGQPLSGWAVEFTVKAREFLKLSAPEPGSFG